MNVNLDGAKIELKDHSELINSAESWYEKLTSNNRDYLGAKMTGWVDLPNSIDDELISDIEETAKEIRQKCTLFVVIGIGGSFLGAKAVTDALGSKKEGWPDIEFAGYNMSASYLTRLCKRIATESTCICAISKSGRTTEPLLTYSILREKIFEKYGIEEAKKRIYIITDKEKGFFKEDADKNGFKTFVVPEDVGGRYSVLTPVGLLPIAAGGHNIRMLIKGASDISKSAKDVKKMQEYAATRVALQGSGKCIEIFEYFENDLRYFGEWLKQLFGESEGKNGKGAYPACLSFSRDLHSIGQFLQEGNQIFYETMIIVNYFKYDFVVPEFAGYPFAGRTLEEINECSESGVRIAHEKDGIPVITLDIPILDEYNVGQMIYFFEMSAALSAYLLGLNPFNQPGVEAYKSETKKLVENIQPLGK